jgi:signal transduction histidine kinase
MTRFGSPSSPTELNQRLVEQYTEIATLAGGLAHEIKNPLSTIRLNMELLAEDFADPQSPRDRRALAKIATVQRECQRLQNLLDDFLNFARQGRIHLEPTNLNQELQRILEFFRPTADASAVDLFCYFDPELPSVMLDREAFQGAVLNLLLNAQQAMTEGGQLTIRTRTTLAGVALDLIDTGCGMDEQTLSKIFKAFYSTKPGGSGLGLATTRKIIDAHRGRIAVQSEVGRGTQFTIELPVPPRLEAK